MVQNLEPGPWGLGFSVVTNTSVVQLHCPSITPIDYSSFHFIFHYPYITLTLNPRSYITCPREPAGNNELKVLKCSTEHQTLYGSVWNEGYMEVI